MYHLLIRDIDGTVIHTLNHYNTIESAQNDLEQYVDLGDIQHNWNSAQVVTEDNIITTSVYRDDYPRWGTQLF